MKTKPAAAPPACPECGGKETVRRARVRDRLARGIEIALFPEALLFAPKKSWRCKTCGKRFLA
jgi:transposase